MKIFNLSFRVATTIWNIRVRNERISVVICKFKTPEKVLNASRSELLEIKGVGDSTIVDLMSLRKTFYEGV